MTVPPEIADALRQWIRKTEHNLEAASRILAVAEGCPFDTVCFHRQQAAEKYVKCLLTYLGVQFPRTHDLKALVALIPIEQGFPIGGDLLSELTPYAVGCRYIDDWLELELADAQSAISLAREVRSVVRTQLPSAIINESAA
jgi:HEPN domain-containing protein